MYRLMIKTHNKTGLSYLCVTRRDDFLQYTGSGVYWRKHLEKHGIDFTTTVLFESEHKDEAFIQYCKDASKELDVVRSDAFANLMEECANSTRDWKSLPEETKLKISASLRSWWESDSSDALREKHSAMAAINLHTEEATRRRNAVMSSEQYRVAKSSVMKEYFQSMTEYDRQVRGKTISEGRLSMSDEAKAMRAAKVSESFKNSAARAEFNERMKTDRVGTNNPSAQLIEYDGVTFNKQQFLAYCKERQIDPLPYLPAVASKKLLADPLVCHHCGFVSRTGVGFTRWHGGNCKHAPKS